MLNVYVFGNIPHNNLVTLNVKHLIFRDFKKNRVQWLHGSEFSLSLPCLSLSVSGLHMQQSQYFVHLHLPLFI